MAFSLTRLGPIRIITFYLGGNDRCSGFRPYSNKILHPHLSECIFLHLEVSHCSLLP